MFANVIHKVLSCENKNEGMQKEQSSEAGLLHYSNRTSHCQHITQSNREWPEGSGSQSYVPGRRNDNSFLHFSLLPSLPTPQVPHRAKDLGSCLWLVSWATSRISELACSRPWWTMNMVHTTTAACRPVISLRCCGLQKPWSRPGLPAALSQLTSIQSPSLFQTPTEQTLIQLLCYAPVESSTEEAPRE